MWSSDRGYRQYLLIQSDCFDMVSAVGTLHYHNIAMMLYPRTMNTKHATYLANYSGCIGSLSFHTVNPPE